MLCIRVTRAAGLGHILKAEVLEGFQHGPSIENRNDWKTFEAAKLVAAALGAGYLATDAGPHVSPRYDVIEVPQVGDDVSYAFNGDYYPCGKVVQIYRNLSCIVTKQADGRTCRFYKQGDRGTWKMDGTWTLVKGTHSRLNPEF